GLIAGYYFETQAQVDEWTFIGANGSNWLWSVNNPGAYDYTEYAHEGSHFIMSYSFIDYDGAYQADNWAISPAVTLPEGEAYVSFYANQANVSYPEAISVYVGLTPDPADMILLQANVSPNTGFDDPWTNYQIDLSDYAGETIYLAFYDYNYDMYEIWIDQVEFFGQGGEPQPTEPVEPTPEPTEPTEMNAELVMGSAEAAGGEIVELPLTISGDYEAHIINVEIHYDPAVLGLVSVENGSLIPDDAFTSIDTETEGVIYVGFVCSSDGVTGEGELVVLTFQVAEEFTEETPVEIDVKQLGYMPIGENEPTPIEFTSENGKVTPKDETMHATFTMGSEYEVSPSTEVTLPLTVDGNYEAHIINLTITYDPDALELLDYELGELPDDVILSIDTETEGVIYVGLVFPTDGITGETVLANFTFKTADDFSEETPVELAVNEFGYMPEDAANAEPIEYTLENGVVTPVTTEPTDEPVEPTDEPVEPTDEPVEPTDEPVEPTEPAEMHATFTMGSEYEVPGGSIITLPFSVEGEFEAHIFNIYLNYDPDVLEVVSVEKSDFLADIDEIMYVEDHETVPGSIRIGIILTGDPIVVHETKDGEGVELVEVTFKVTEDFTEETPITVEVNEFGYMPAPETVPTPIEYETVDGVVTPIETEPVEPTEPPVEPTDEPVEPTDEPVEPTDEPVEPTDEPVEPTNEPQPTDEPGPGPQPPVTGAASLIGLGIAAIAVGAGIVIFRKKED
ncbi:MAG: choice-of-anchor J domain-containing protein, partial [Clostridiales bacterium]|nr:choice-of-anchor J domain-containing protein [Clostridiales bacterium]